MRFLQLSFSSLSIRPLLQPRKLINKQRMVLFVIVIAINDMMLYCVPNPFINLINCGNHLRPRLIIRRGEGDASYLHCSKENFYEPNHKYNGVPSCCRSAYKIKASLFVILSSDYNNGKISLIFEITKHFDRLINFMVNSKRHDYTRHSM